MTDPSAILSGLLSPDGSTRQTAEQQLHIWQAHPNYGVNLAQIIVGGTGRVPVEQRHLSCTLLKQYIETHWSETAVKFTPPQPSNEQKTNIRNILPNSLRDPETCIRVGGAYAIAAIARYDLPDAWPSLFDLVRDALKSADAIIVDGGIRVCAEVVTSVTEQQIRNIPATRVPECLFLPELLHIFSHIELFSLQTRTRAVAIFSSVTELIHKMIQSDATAGHRVGYYYYLQRFTETFLIELTAPEDGRVSNLALKTEIIKAWTLTTEKFEKQLQKNMPRLLPLIGEMLERSSLQYGQVVGDVENETATVDTDSLEQFIFALLDLVHAILNQRRYIGLITESLPSLVRLLIVFVQIPEEKVEEWENDPQKYVEEEDMDSCVNNIRMSALELLMNLCEIYGAQAVAAMCSAVEHYIGLSNTRKEAKDNNWWKIREACYTAMGTVVWILLKVLKEKSPPIAFDLYEFMNTNLIPDITRHGPRFLQGHAISFAGQIADTWGSSGVKPLLDICAQALSPKRHIIIRICACRAFVNFCEKAKGHNIELSKLFDMKPVVVSLVQMGICTSEAVFNLVLSALLAVVQADTESATADSKMIPLCTAAILKFSGDPVIPSQVAELIQTIVAVPACRAQIEQSMFTTICSIINRDDTSKFPIRLPAVCLEVMEAIVRGSPLPLSDAVVNNGFPVVVRCILATDDCNTLAAGRECIRAYISRAVERVINWTDGTNSGITLIVRVICHLLSPSSPELSAGMVGRLIFVLLKRANTAISPYLEEILRAVLYKLYSSELNSVRQSLLMVFAHLIHYQMEALLMFLSSIPAPNDSNALRYVLTLWCEKQNLFFGAYDQKVSTLALRKLFLYAVSSPDGSLREMTVMEESGKTGSENDTFIQPRSIPLLVKIFKLLIDELADQLELHQKESKGEVGTVGGVEEESSEDDAGAGAQGDQVIAVMREIVAGLQDDIIDDVSDENDDPDVAEDAISNVDLVRELTNFLRQLSQQTYFHELCQHLTESERAVLGRINQT